MRRPMAICRKVIIQVKYIIMQNSISLSPKDQGDVSMSSSPGEKQLTQQMSESPGKRVYTDCLLSSYRGQCFEKQFSGLHLSLEGESSIPSGTIQSGKNLQSKSQFRTIAPKIVPKVLTSRMLPCPSPSLSDRGSLGPSLTSKTLGMGMPTQNYVLMQVAGQEGTFSLVALPNVASAQSIQKPRMSPPENLKLPIPRYQPLRNNKGPRKKPSLNSPERGCSKIPAPAQVCPQMSPFPPAYLELLTKPTLLKQAPSLDQAPGSSISTPPPTSSGGHRDSEPPVTNSHGDLSTPATPASSTLEELSAMQSISKIPGKANFLSREPPRNPAAAAAASEKLEEQVSHAKAVTSLSPAISVQMICSAPKDFSVPGYGTDCDRRCPITEGFQAAAKMASKVPVQQIPKQRLCESIFCPVTKPDLNHKTKLNGGATKRRVRKRKVPDEILAFQGKRKKCLINKCRDGKERIKNDPQESRDQKPGAMRKYRSIMPKPTIVMSAAVPLTSPSAALQSQTPSSLRQEIFLNSSFTPKYLSYKQNDSLSPKSISGFKSGFSGIKKPWHRCHVCNHHFQFKQHLRDHMNTHTNRRPYSCRICRKAYVRPGSLSTHMKLHHSENRLRKLMCCEFCAKVFGHVRVYFGHLKEVHRVVISTEPSSNDPQPGDMPKKRDRETSVQGMEGSLERENKSSLEEDFLLNQADEVKLQIKCGRCHITTHSFAEIKFHLLCVHGEEIQGRLQEGILPGSRIAQETLVKHTAPDWKPHPERRKQVRPYTAEDTSCTLPRLKRQFCLHHQKGGVEQSMHNEGGQQGKSEPQGLDCASPRTLHLWSHLGFNCLLCTQTLGRKEELLLHWGCRHNCEDPSRLWTVLSAVSNQGVIELSPDAEK
ncbi:zinc finger protein 438 isoform X5 [Castor canadensis]|uniref:Zinc finger protein 438 isoform X5 n=1 Tax=Castor canadensis TaxID=51338 RepID=A0AC58L560_CASCN